MKRIASYLIALATMAFTFTSCEDVPSPFGEIVPPSGEEKVVIDPTGSGTEADPYNVAAVLEYISGLGADTPSEKEVYIKGYAVELTDISAQYGNATFTMSDDVDGKANKFTVYRAAGLDNQKVTDANFIKQGDVVVVCGKVTNYKGNTPETIQGSAYVYSVNGKGGSGGGGGDTPSGDAKGSGTQADPFNVAAAIAKCKETGETATKDEYYIKGLADADFTVADDNYKNATFDMVDAAGSSEKFKAFRVFGPNGQKLKAGYKIPKGATVIVCSKIVNYKGNTPETVQTTDPAYNGTLVSVNGQAPEIDGGGGGDTPLPDQPKGTGTVDNPFNVAAAIAKCKETGQTATTEEYYVKGIADADCTIANDNYKNATFDMVDVAGAAEKFKAFRVLAPNGQKLKPGYKIPKGATVIVCGKLVNYKDNTPETVQTTDPAYNGTLVSVNGQAPEADGQGGGEQGGGGESGGGEVTDNSITVDFSSLGLSNQEKVTTLSLNDGTTLTFSDGGNKSAPAYYNTGTALRMYPKNTMTIDAGSKKIAAIEIACDEYQGTLYNASGDITVGNTKMTIDGNNLKYSGPNASSATISNTSSTTGAPSQLRMKTLIITYAK